MYSRNMGGVPNPWNALESTPPPSTSSSTSSNMTMLYYGLVVVGAAALVLAIYHLIVIRWCTRQHIVLQASRITQFSEGMRRRGLKNSDRNLLSSFKYKKEVGVQAKGQEVHKVEYECSVCLSVFEEGEEVKILPRCKHSFHAACIDMWLYSHFDCPLCRQPVRPLCHQLLQVSANSTQSSQSHEVLTIQSDNPV